MNLPILSHSISPSADDGHQPVIDWMKLQERRPAMLANLGKPEYAYLLLPEVNELIDLAKHPQTRVAILWKDI